MEKRREFGVWLKAMRNEKGLTLFQACEALGYKSHGTISLLEQGRGTLPVERIHPIARIYGIDLKELLKKIEECEPNLYRKYMILERDIIRMFANQTRGITPQGKFALHHKPFPRFEVDRNISYQTLDPDPRLICTISLKEPRKIADKGNGGNPCHVHPDC